MHIDNEKINKYCEFVKNILKQYNIDYDQISFIQQSENMTFRIEDKATREKYLVRVHQSMNQDDAKYQNNKNLIRCELLLLELLCHDRTLTVQRPVGNKDGDFITQAYCQWLNKDLCITVLQWLDGEIIDINDDKYDGLASQLGETMARAHQALNSLELPKDFTRMVYDLGAFKSNVLKLNKLTNLGILSDLRLDEIHKCTMNILKFIETNLTEDKHWGLLHGDLHEGNYIVNGEKIFFIDFSRCGFGYYLYDIAQTFMHLGIKNRQEFLKAYTKIIVLPNNCEKLLEGFFILSIIENMLFLSSNPDEHDHVINMANYLCDYALAHYIQDQRFILGNG